MTDSGPDLELDHGQQSYCLFVCIVQILLTNCTHLFILLLVSGNKGQKHYRQTNRWTDRQTVRQIDRQRERDTHTHTRTHTRAKPCMEAGTLPKNSILSNFAL